VRTHNTPKDASEDIRRLVRCLFIFNFLSCQLHLIVRPDSMNTRPRSDRRTYQTIALQLTEKINKGELPDGSRLPSERELAGMFGASRSVIREALVSLQTSGLIFAREKARARVTQLNNPAFLNQLTGAAQSLLARPHGIADFQEARVLFECGLVRHAARHASQKELERMAIALARNKKAIGDSRLFAKTDLAFHDILADIPKNPIFSALNAALCEWLMRQRTVVIQAPIRGIMRRAYRGHEAIFEAVAARDVERADAVMADHLTSMSEAYWRSLAAGAE
jgi:DNA-binding FadR family transcriptional regulator